MILALYRCSNCVARGQKFNLNRLRTRGLSFWMHTSGRRSENGMGLRA